MSDLERKYLLPSPDVSVDVEHYNVEPSLRPVKFLKCEKGDKETAEKKETVDTGIAIHHGLEQETGKILHGTFDKNRHFKTNVFLCLLYYMVDLSEIRDRDVDLVDPVRVSQEDPTHGKEPGKN